MRLALCMHCIESMLVNLTPHTIVLHVAGEERIVPPTSPPARVASVPGAHLGDMIYAAPTWGDVEGLPLPEAGVVYIVSMLVAGRCAGRTDVVSPGTGPSDAAVRDENGRIIAVTRLIQAPAVIS